MRVYAETNFVLEIVFEQEQHAACDDLINLGVSKAVEVVLPAYALLEPAETIVRREKASRQLRGDINKRERDLRRSASKAGEAQQLRNASDLLLRAEQEASTRFSTTCARLLDVARLITIDAAVLKQATQLVGEFDLRLPDALMLAAVLTDAAQDRSPSVFLNRDTKGFDDPGIASRLGALSCELILSFTGGLARANQAISALLLSPH